MPQSARGRLLLATVLGALLAAPGTASAAVSAGQAETIALDHVRANAAALGVTAADVQDLSVLSNYSTADTGVRHVSVLQRYDGREVFGAQATVNVAADGRVIFVGDSFQRGLKLASDAADVAAADAVDAAADELGLDEPSGLRVLSREGGPAQRTVLSDGGISDAPIEARLGYHAGEGGLRLAWQIVIDDSSDVDLWNATVDAGTGELLQADNWTHSETPEEAGVELSALPASMVLAPVQVDDGSSYRVFNFAKESPNDGPRDLVANPADQVGSRFGWHDTDGAQGAEFTTTRGNNVHAYLDQDANNQPDVGADVNGGPGLDFDFPLDLTQHAQHYRDSATANLFYANNAIHDILFRYGFDEAAGNFQQTNYSNQGGGGDYVRAEAADGNGTNNANFSTPAADSGTPRMQMFLWPGNQFGAQNQVSVSGGASFDAGWARFGSAVTTDGVTGAFVVAGTGCTAELYPVSLPSGNWIAVLDGGTGPCSYSARMQVAESLGADAAVIVTGTSATILSTPLTTFNPTIPVVSMTVAVGDQLKAAIAAGGATGTVRKHPSHPGIRDGDLENGIIIHEYGHGVSNRLTGGPGINCLSGNEQAGEGWSDYLAITMLLDPTLETPDGPRGMGPYALFQPNRQGNGIRPRPYSRNMEIQPFTYDSIKTQGWLNRVSLAAPHGIGHGWASVLWDLNWDLIDKYGFNPNIYEAWDTGGNNRALQYVIDGLKAQGCAPGFVAARNGILAGVASRGGADTCSVWATFARRGLGYSAVQGTTARDDNTEAFDTHPSCHRGFRNAGAQPALNTVEAGSTKPLHFTADGYQGLDVLAKAGPYSRQVDCTTLRTETPGQVAITPRPVPVALQTPGNSALSVGNGQFNFPWKTDAAWVGTCREVVMTRTDGKQHRAYFRFVAATQ